MRLCSPFDWRLNLRWMQKGICCYYWNKKIDISLRQWRKEEVTLIEWYWCIGMHETLPLTVLEIFVLQIKQFEKVSSNWNWGNGNCMTLELVGGAYLAVSRGYFWLLLGVTSGGAQGTICDDWCWTWIRYVQNKSPVCCIITLAFSHFLKRGMQTKLQSTDLETISVQNYVQLMINSKTDSNSARLLSSQVIII